MRISRLLTAGALALTLAVTGCSSNGDDPADESGTRESPEDGDDAPAGGEETPGPDSTGEETLAGTDSADEETPGPDSAGEETLAGTDDPGSISSGIDADAHPFCAVLAKYEDEGDIDGVPTETQIARIKEMRDDAVKHAPEELDGHVEVYFDTLLETAEASVTAGEVPDLEISDLSEEFQDAFGAILSFSFDTCLEIDSDLDFEPE